MVDAFAPSVEALKPRDDDGGGQALDRAVTAAKQGAEATVPLVARKGRASYLGERSAGHKDPGSVSTLLLFEALQQAARPPS
jgi:dihydroxyacetone kinase-like protein